MDGFPLNAPPAVGPRYPFAFRTLLLKYQTSIFAGILRRTGTQSVRGLPGMARNLP